MKFNEIHERNVEQFNETHKRNVEQAEADRKRAEFLIEMEDDLLPNKSRLEQIEELKEIKENLIGKNKLDSTNFHK